MTEKLIIKRKNGKTTMRGCISAKTCSDAAIKLRRGEIEPTFGYKLRRFCKRMFWTARAVWDKITVGYDYGDFDICPELPETHSIDIPLR